ncbi:MAG: patatin-like phospholipase family protein [Firmicutes bacterium]|nr:patatin-like phospholipase family protein [Bacillota bacterium]
MSNNKKWALVFAGGGGNGAFEIGAWRAIDEAKMFDICAVSGSSVGALNAALYAVGDFKTANEIWQNIRPRDIIPIKPHKILNKVKNIHKKMSVCSTDGLRRLIAGRGLIEKLQKSDIPCIASCTFAPQSITEHADVVINGERVSYFDLRKQSRERITDILLASSAIPVVFPQQKIDGQYFKDGDFAGLGDCMPVIPLYDMGCRNFIVIHLDRYKPIRLNKTIKNDKNVEFLHIYPPREMDKFRSIFNFNNCYIKKRINMGYKSTKRLLEAYKNADKRIYTCKEPLKRLLEDRCAFNGLKILLDKVNIPLKVTDAEKFWRVLAENKKYKLEQHLFTHHARLLEKRGDGNYRVAWGSKNAIEKAFDVILHLDPGML